MILTDAFAFMGRVFDLAAGALSLSPTAFAEAGRAPAAIGAALFIAFLAGASEMVGQSVILVLNRTPTYRFLASLAFTGGVYLLQACIWALGVMAVAPLARAEIVATTGVAGLFTLIAMSYAPRLFGVFAIAPYFGLGLSQFLDAWMMTCVIFGLHAAAGTPLAAAGIVGISGWLAAFLVRSLFGRFLRGPLGVLRRLVSGSALALTPAELLARFTDRDEPDEGKV